MTLEMMWPKPEETQRVLRGDATAAYPAVLMAVHQPMRVQVRAYHEQSAQDVDESAILQAVNLPNPDGCQIVLIEGPNGTGKSHVVRWLNEKLAQQAHQSHQEVVLVTKGSSLGDIIKKILELDSLKGAQGAAIRERLERMKLGMALREHEAAGLLCQRLYDVCRSRLEARKQATASPVRGPQTPEEQEREEMELGWLEDLPSLLLNDELRDFLVGENKPASRLVQSVIRSTEHMEAREKKEFAETDFVWSVAKKRRDDRVSAALARLQDLQHRVIVASLLNEMLDEAKQILTGVDPTVIFEAFRTIRRILLAERKELVLLIEDFSDLSGLQRSVLQVAIEQAGDASGQTVLCTLRTVIAFTTNYIARADAVFQRAGRVFVIPEESRGEQDSVDRATALVAAYLHASRVGVDSLKKAYQEAPSQGCWVPKLSLPEGFADVEAAFGSAGGYPLFPFTQEVVRKLAEEELPTMRRYIPRLVVRQVIPRVLNHRQEFVDGTFPGKSWEDKSKRSLGEDDLEFVGQFTGEDRDRWRRVLLYWGATDIAALQKTFRLPVPKEQHAGIRKRPEEVKVKLDPEERKEPEEHRKPEERKKQQTGDEFDEWATHVGKPFSAEKARRALRDAVGGALRKSIPEWLPAKAPGDKDARLAGWTESIEIPRISRTDAATRTLLHVVEAADMEDVEKRTVLAKELRAVNLVSTSRDVWTMPNAEDVAVDYLAFTERNWRKVDEFLTHYWRKETTVDVAGMVTNALLATSRVFQVTGGKAAEPEIKVRALLQPVPEVSCESEWANEYVKPLLEARGTGPYVDSRLRKLLVELFGAFRGGAVQAIDAVGMLQALARPLGPERGWTQVTFSEPQQRDVPALHALQQMKNLLTAKRSRDAAEREWKRRRELAVQVRKALGDSADVHELRAAATAALAECKEFMDQSVSVEVEHHVAGLKTGLGEALVHTERLAETPPQDTEELFARLVANLIDAANLDAQAPAVAGIHELVGELEQTLGRRAMEDPLDLARQSHRAAVDGLLAVLGDGGVDG